MNISVDKAQTPTDPISRDLTATNCTTQRSGRHLRDVSGITNRHILNTANCQTFHTISKAQAMTRAQQGHRKIVMGCLPKAESNAMLAADRR
jgi:hypothetical protein